MCASNGQCASQLNICNNDIDCLDYESCISACAPADSSCFQVCGILYPFGEQEYYDYALCVVCGACYNDCNGAGSGCP